MQLAIASRVTITLILLLSSAVYADSGTATSPMTQQRMHEVIAEVGSDVFIEANLVGFTYDGARLLCVSDIGADRMRIISAIVDVAELAPEQVFIAMAANFHSALDARYAISDGVIYAAYIHPLSPLSDTELVSAIRQVASAHNTFGVEYSSGELFFGGDSSR